MEIAAGLFALAGVGLAGALGEIQRWRETARKKDEEFRLLKRQTYATALRLMETLASRAARVLEVPSHDQVNRPLLVAAFWESITEAYQVLGEVRLITGRPSAADVMNGALRRYRDLVEHSGTELPKTTAAREELVRLFREDLGLK